MKTIASIILFFLSISLYSQSCNDFYILNKGVEFEYAHYNNKNKLEYTNSTTVIDVVQKDDGWIIQTDNVASDEKGQGIHKWKQEYRCKDGVLSFDMNSMFDQKQMSEFKDMEVQIVSDKLEIPSTLTVGQTLNNGSATLTVSNQGMKIMTMTVTITNRKVESKESITLPAGTFDCFKITYNIETKSIFKAQATAAEWYAKGIGMVKQESYDNNGKLVGYTVLNRFKK